MSALVGGEKREKGIDGRDEPKRKIRKSQNRRRNVTMDAQDEMAGQSVGFSLHFQVVIATSGRNL